MPGIVFSDMRPTPSGGGHEKQENVEEAFAAI